MAEGAAELVEEAAGQAGAARVEVAQIGEEVLLGAVAAVGLRPSAGWRRKRELTSTKARRISSSRGSRRSPRGRLAGDQALDAAAVGVVAEHQAPRLFQALGARAGGGVRRGRQARRAAPGARGRRA